MGGGERRDELAEVEGMGVGGAGELGDEQALDRDLRARSVDGHVADALAADEQVVGGGERPGQVAQGQREQPGPEQLVAQRGAAGEEEGDEQQSIARRAALELGQ